MSTFRNIIARRRPAEGLLVEEPEPVEPFGDLLSEASDQNGARSEIPDEVRWELDPPPPTIGDHLLVPQEPEPEGVADAADARPVTGRRRIWDLDRDPEMLDGAEAEDCPRDDPAPGGELHGANEIAHPAMATPDPAPERLPDPVTAAAPDPALARPGGGGRVKTRLLGFNADVAASDAFAAERAPAATSPVTCPVGWVVIVEGPGRGTAFALAPGLSTIGRGSDQTIPLDFGDDSISRDNHASIAYDDEENEVLIGHGGKSNLVRLNGRPLVSSAVLNNGDQVRVGKTTLRFVALCGPDFSWSETQDGAAGHG